MTGPTYFAASDEKDIAGKILAKVDNHDGNRLVQQIRERLGKAYQYYFGFDGDGNHATSAILRDGEMSELAKYRVNHSRALVNTLVNLVVSQRVVWQPKATNIDHESLRQTEIAAAVLEYYWGERQVEKYVHRAVEEGIALSEGFVLMGWDEFLGEDVAPDPETLPDGAPLLGGPAAQEPDTSHGPNGPEDVELEATTELAAEPRALEVTEEVAPARPQMIRSGDLTFENVSWWNVIRDPHKPSWDQLDWVIVRVYRNKFDLAARFPAVAEHILNSPAESSNDDENPNPEEGDDIPVFHFYHKATAAVPYGREVVVLQNKTVLRDTDLQFDEWPLYRVAPAEMFGTPFGYTPFLEGLGIQELIDSLHSSVATNQLAFATQNLIIEQGCEIDPDQLAGGMRVITKPTNASDPKALQLCATPAEVFKHLEVLKHDQEMMFGVNPTVRGQIQSDKLSGAALALLESQAKQQSSGLHGSSLRMVQALGNGVIGTLRRRCWAPRKIAIVGQEGSYLVREESYSQDSFGAIKRVLVDIGNPLSQTAGGRMEMAKELLQMQLLSTPEQYYQVLTSGRLDPVTKGMSAELMLIRSENEDISKGVKPTAMVHDNHLLHGREHRIPVSNPTARKNPALLAAHIEHMHEHYRLYYGTEPMVPQMDPLSGLPAIDMMTGQPVLVPEPMYREKMLLLMGLQPPQAMATQEMATAAAPGAGAPAPVEEALPGMPPGKNETAQLPSFPTNPSTGREWDPDTSGGAN